MAFEEHKIIFLPGEMGMFLLKSILIGLFSLSALEI